MTTVLVLFGAVIGLLLGALASVPLSKLPAPLGGVMPAVASVALTLIVTIAVLSRRQALARDFAFLRGSHAPNPATASAPAIQPETPAEPETPRLPQILVDTSAIIDGRIADIATAGFVPGRLVVPRFVLAELQNIADSDDAMRRGRGRRGLDVLNRLREMSDLEVDIIEDDVPGIREVDAKLVALGQRFSCNVLTTDYNLNRVAQIQGVRVLNVNELSNAIRPVVLPGEELVVRVVQPGKERNQGVGYLADGTMIVVENGDKLMNQEVVTEVTRVFQTVAGKMIFAVPRKPIPGLSPAPVASEAPVAPRPAAMNPPSKPKPPVVAETAPGEPGTRAEGNDKDKPSAPHKPHFNRNRKRVNGNNAAAVPGATPAPPAPVAAATPTPSSNVSSTRATPQTNKPHARPHRSGSIEDRLIAATNQPPHHE